MLIFLHVRKPSVYGSYASQVEQAQAAHYDLFCTVVYVHGENDRNHNTVVPPQKDGKHLAAQLSGLSDPAQLRPHVLASLHAAVQAFRQDSSQHEVHMHLSTSC